MDNLTSHKDYVRQYYRAFLRKNKEIIEGNRLESWMLRNLFGGKSGRRLLMRISNPSSCP